MLLALLPFMETHGHGMTAISSHGLLVVRIQFGSLHHSFHSETGWQQPVCCLETVQGTRSGNKTQLTDVKYPL